LRIGRLMKKHPDIYYTHIDEQAIQQAAYPVEKARELVQQAPLITQDAVENALSAESLQAIEVRLEETSQKYPQLKLFSELMIMLIGEEKHAEIYEKSLRKFALWQLFTSR